MATNYKYSKELWLNGRPQLHVIKTKISNICTETICKPLTDTSYYGINGAFFDSRDYHKTPNASRAICVDTGESGKKITVGGKTFYKNYNYNNTSSNPISRKTAVIYTVSGTKKMTSMYAKTRDNVAAKYPKYNQIIGGMDYSSKAWGTKAYSAPTQRTVLAWSGSYAYLIVTEVAMSIPGLKKAVEQLGLNSANSIVLDGSGSTSMKCKEFVKKGDKRHIFNMVRLFKTS
ncbi:hypothetical protein SB717_32745 [Priestia sp. SIMBA_032]|uniref:hypothetical protein n=1 Tax=Priestia sp. SIMBA_032 TaxID=3085775 RepID=UPI00397AE447